MSEDVGDEAPDDAPDAAPDAAPDPRDARGRFLAGNPGKPKGARHALGEAFIKALHADFVRHGVETIEKVRADKPETYLRVVASLLPKEFTIEPVGELTDDQLDARIRKLASLLEAGVAEPVGGGEAAEGSSTAH